MNIIVCVKQVPSIENVKFDMSTNTVIRDGMDGVINTDDIHAVEEAISIKEKIGGTITVLSMGKSSVSSMLKRILAMGVDEGVLLSDNAFAGADTLATAYVLSRGIQKIGNYDLVICGNKAIDGDTGQVGPSLAEKLNIPHVSYVDKIHQIASSNVVCQRSTDNGFDILEMDLPGLITVGKNINTPRNPTLKGMKMAKEAVIKVYDADDISADKRLCGKQGSPTQVIKTFFPEYGSECEIVEGTLHQQVRLIADLLEDF